MKEKYFIINEEEKEELKFILSLNYSEEKSARILGDCFLNAKRIGFLRGFICNRLPGNEDFMQNSAISPLLETISKLPRDKAKLLWDLLYWKLLHTKNKEEKELILMKLEEVNDPYLKIYFVNSFRREDAITSNELKKVLDFSKELELFGFKTRNARELLNNFFTLMEEADELSVDFKENLKQILDNFVNAEQDKHRPEELKDLLFNFLIMKHF